jgi:tripartite-type tricarboxylate transporter receptor subunit TctC
VFRSVRPLALRACSAVLLLGTAAAQVAAQTYPDRPVRIIVPFAAGGGTDYLARLVTERLTTGLGQPVVIENRTGAAGAVGSEAVARAKPDGYTILFTPGAELVTRPLLMKANPVDPLKDFTPIIAPLRTFSIIAANNGANIATGAELVEAAKRKPASLAYGTPGVGSAFHFAGEQLKARGVDLLHVPYRGAAPALAAVMAGETPLSINDLAITLPMMQAGKVRGLAVLEGRRHPALPNVPTMGESLPGYEMPESWFGFFGPVDLPAPIVQRLNAEIARAYAAPDVKARLDERLAVVVPGPPEDVTAIINRSAQVYGAIARRAGMQPE